MDWLGSEASVYLVNRVWNDLLSHEGRDEVWTVVSGSGQVVVDGVTRGVSAGDVIDLTVGCKHTVIASGDGLQIIEVQMGKKTWIQPVIFCLNQYYPFAKFNRWV